MAVELKRLIKKVSHMDITLLAGEDGLNKMVSWVHMVETKEACTFLEGGEIAFCTGIGLNNGLSIFDLVKSLHENHASGAVINIGPFIESIPDELIEYGNTNHFPIFTVPWKIHIAEIMRIFCYTITKSDQANLEISVAFKNAIFYPKHEELYVVPLSRYNFHVNWHYYVCAIKITDKYQQNIPAKQLESICISLEQFMHHRQFDNFAMFCHENQLVIVLGNYESSLLDSFIDTLASKLKLTLNNNQNYHMGIGKCTKSIRCLYKSFHQAKSIQNLQERNKISKSLISYSKMGIYKLLMGIEDREIVSEYYEQTIEKLIEYDQKNDSDLSIVLRSYLHHNGSVKDTALELFVHRNTINYKLNKAAEILDVDLSMLEVRLQLIVAFMLKDMYELTQ